MPDEPPYRVEPGTDSDKFNVIDTDGRSILVCRDEQSAAHYATILSQAFQRGYRTGFRAAKSSDE